MIERKKEKKVKLITNSEKPFDTEGDFPNENIEQSLPFILKGVLKKYDPDNL